MLWMQKNLALEIALSPLTTTSIFPVSMVMIIKSWPASRSTSSDKVFGATFAGVRAVPIWAVRPDGLPTLATGRWLVSICCSMFDWKGWVIVMVPGRDSNELQCRTGNSSTSRDRNELTLCV